ncbi:MAG: hypothetical protein AB1634_15660 [Thermodesulfobacteriota bacterium]
MESTIIAGIIGGISTIIAGIGGAFIGKSEKFDRIFRKNDLPNFVGTKWESSWLETIEGKNEKFKEHFEFTKQKGDKVHGIITSDQYPGMKWNIEGDYNDRFLRLFWTPSKDSENHFFLDYGTYFFERNGDGNFKGFAVGYDSRTSQVEFGEHILKKIAG